MIDAVNKIIKQAERTITVNNGDYKDDSGLWVCGKCNTRKQIKLELFDGRTVTPMCLCECEAGRLHAEQKEREREERQRQIKEMRKTGFPDADMTRWTFENDDLSNKELTKACKNYVENFKEFKKNSKGLLLYGTLGTGKTYFASCIANELINRGYPCLVTNFARLINTIQGMYEGKQKYIDGLDKFDLLVIDDLASERDTEYMNETVFNIIDARYRSGKPLIVTTNLTAKELNNPQDIRKQRIYSRLIEMCLPLEVKGTDRRKKNLDKELYKMLGF